MRTKIMFIILFFLVSCVKQQDIEQAQRVAVISERFTNPPMINSDKTWKPYTVKKVYLDPGTYPGSYMNLKPDTIISTCSIDKIDSNFKIEIRKYAIE